MAISYDPVYKLSSSAQDVSLGHRPVVYRRRTVLGMEGEFKLTAVALWKA